MDNDSMKEKDAFDVHTKEIDLVNRDRKHLNDDVVKKPVVGLCCKNGWADMSKTTLPVTNEILVHLDRTMSQCGSSSLCSAGDNNRWEFETGTKPELNMTNHTICIGIKTNHVHLFYFFHLLSAARLILNCHCSVVVLSTDFAVGL
ncbi:Caveolin-1 [Acipenser ruthenus]|uniref:Caveolin-1 n=1 Tax=Acipenser ruthenus TaxID=7906 RepID=A0A662YTG9_ACIRT|nr:Caveolin-1 [Acipenser ruthenus]